MQAPTRILDASKEAEILEAVSLLRSGGVVALPTETVYGLAANALSPQSVAKIFKAKKRPENNPLIWHVHDQEAAKNLFNFSNFAELSKKRFTILAETYWPGPLTLVAEKSSLVSAHVSLDTIAVRVPACDITLKILKLLQIPLVMPSANISSRPSPTCSAHVLKTLTGRIDAVVDAGVCKIGIESTVIRIDQAKPRILRPGYISAYELEKILGEPVLNYYKPSEISVLEALESPGLAHKHYAPHVAEVVLIKPDELDNFWTTTSSIIARTSDLKKCEEFFKKRPNDALTIALPNEPKLFAANIYNALYRAEEYPEEKLVLVMPKLAFEDIKKSQNPWAAVYDRLRRSAECEL